MIEDVYRYQEDLESDGVYFSVSGPFSHTLLEGIAKMLKRKMARDDTEPAVMMDVFSVLVEQAQNVIRHSAEIVSEEMAGEKGSEVRIGTLVIGNRDGAHFVLSGNRIGNHAVDDVREQLTKVSHMTKAELRKYYRTSLRKKRRPGSRGAGLGFIEMAKRASMPIEFGFRKIDDSVSYFSIKTTI